MQFYGISFIDPYKKSGRWNFMLSDTRLLTGCW